MVFSCSYISNILSKNIVIFTSMEIQYYIFKNKKYIIENNLAKIGELGIMIHDGEADVFETTFEIIKYNKNLKRAKELLDKDLTPKHYIEQTKKERFEIRKVQLLKMGFIIYNGIDFHLKDIWFCYWERVYDTDEETWLSHILSIEEAHNKHFMECVKWQ